jgi:hypothetical protein
MFWEILFFYRARKTFFYCTMIQYSADGGTFFCSRFLSKGNFRDISESKNNCQTVTLIYCHCYCRLWCWRFKNLPAHHGGNIDGKNISFLDCCNLWLQWSIGTHGKYRTGRCKGGQTVAQAADKFTGKQICKCLDNRIQADGSTEVFGSYIQRFE